MYLIFLIVLFEGTARLAFLIPQVSKRLSVQQDDLSWRRLWINKHEEIDKKIFQKRDIYDSSKGWVSKPNLSNMKVFDGKILNTNSKGLRGKNEYLYAKDRDKVRILIIGDSFTFGDEVSDNETYSYYLQEMIPNAEIINFGMHGYGHDQILILLKEEGIKYEPDIIILGFISADMSRNLLNFRDYAKPKFVLDKNELRLTRTRIPTPEETVKWDWVRPRIVDIVSLIHYRLRKFSGLYVNEKNEITTAILNEIIKVADSINATSIFVYLPFGSEIFDSTILTPSENYFFAMCKTNVGVTCFSALPRFAEKMTKGVTFKKQGHWSPAGHLAAAEAIMRHLGDGEYVITHEEFITH